MDTHADGAPLMAPALNIVFMIYDSRSGSTLLARKLTEEVKGVAVTPEIGFDSLLRLHQDVLSRDGALHVVRELFKSGDYRNIGVEQAALEAALMDLPEPLTTLALIQLSLGMWHKATGQTATNIIVKNGTHAKYWRDILRIWQEAGRVIYVYRDPRAVINSKLRTPRPYHDYEVMAWGGAMLAAWRWKRYSNLMRDAEEAGLKTLNVQYEQFLANPALELARVSSFLAINAESSQSAGNYSIPLAELKIHKLVSGGAIKAERGEAWRRELSSFDCNAIESVCQAEMSRRGYVPLRTLGKPASFLVLLAALSGSMLKIARHFLLLVLTHAK